MPRKKLSEPERKKRRSITTKRYYQRNKEHIREQQKKYYSENREKLRKIHAKHYLENRKYILGKRKSKRIANTMRRIQEAKENV